MITQYPNLACPCCGLAHLDPALVHAVEHLHSLAYPWFAITSGYRCASHNQTVAGNPHSFHLFGQAIDVRPVRFPMPSLVRLALSIPAFAAGGFGWYPARDIIHLDLRLVPASWCRPNNHYEDLIATWAHRFPLDPLPLVPATLACRRLAHLAQRPPQSPDSPSARPTPTPPPPTPTNGKL